MSVDIKKYFGIPDMDFSGLAKPLSEAECDEAVAKLDRKMTRQEHLAFVERMEAHPEALTAWDMDMPFEEYARRVRAGEYD